jgi:D-glycero-alpha-D-manno-heptose 1-phosphate guanylyltransferase
MDAIVLCGGASTRVRELTQDRIPKILLSIDGRPFIDHLINALLAHGVKGIVFAAGVHGKQIAEYVETELDFIQRRFGFFQVIVEDYPRGTGGAIKCALEHSTILSNQKDIMVVNGDTILIEPNFTHIGSEYNCIAGSEATNDGSFGSVDVSSFSYRLGNYKCRKIESFCEKSAGSKWVNNGWYLLRKKLFENVPDVCSLEFDLLPKWVAEHDFYLIETDKSNKIDIGTTERIKTLRL